MIETLATHYTNDMNFSCWAGAGAGYRSLLEKIAKGCRLQLVWGERLTSGGRVKYKLQIQGTEPDIRNFQDIIRTLTDIMA